MSGSTLLESIFEAQVNQTTFSDPLQALICDEALQLCHDFDLTQIQESWSWRNTYVARELAKALLDDKGEIQRKVLFRAIQLLEQNAFSLGPGRYHDSGRQHHLLKILRWLYGEKEGVYALKRISKPSGHLGAEKLIRETLFLPESKSLTDADARGAALAALLCTLRQNVGSCFATAPAILVQQEHPLQFLDDIGQLLGTGRLKRVVEGVEYSVPLSVSWGMGDLLRPFYVASTSLHLLSRSPGLLAAFEMVNLIDKQAEKEERHNACLQLLQKAHILSEKESPFLVLNAKQIIDTVLLHAFDITQKDLETFQERPFQGPIASLVIQSPIAQGAKTLAINRYKKASEVAMWAFKALTDNALLKAWEFTLASLSESKADFAKWNLYTALGVNPEDAYGIGQSLYEVIQEKLNQINSELAEFQSRYDHLFAQAKYLEGRFSNASERELGWVRAEYQIRRHEIDRALSERDKAYEKGRKLQGLYPLLINFYGEKIRDYFQEVYDAEMLDVSANLYDDSPAGFRLMYKYGRSNTALWTLIGSPAEYIQHLTSFFVSTEIELNQLPALEGMQKEIGDLVTAAITTVKRPEFLEGSIIRLARAYHEPLIPFPLEHLDQIKRKPWSYISGGTMSTLVSCYWDNPQKPIEEKRWVESETEYLAFLIDTIKGLPLSVQQLFLDDPEKSLLAFSPTHAFLCKPGWELFRKAWESDTYTYTWIRDFWMRPQQAFLDSIVLDNRMMDVVVQQLLQFVPAGYRPIAAQALKGFTYSMTPPDFREHVITVLSYEKWLREGRIIELIAEELDSLLYRFLPLFPEHQLKEHLTTLLNAIDEVDDHLRQAILEEVEQVEGSIGKYTILTALDLRDVAKALLMAVLQTTRTPIFYHQKITAAMQKTGLCYPEPFLFADTNWVKNVFGFTISPGTGNLELWRFDACGGDGRPITLWRRYLNGADRQEWGIYTNPRQYG